MIETINQIPVLKRITEILPFGEVWWGFLPLIEIALGLMLIGKIQTKKILLVATVLFSLFLLFALYGTITGLHIDFGCFSNFVRREFVITMILRNFILIYIVYLLHQFRTK